MNRRVVSLVLAAAFLVLAVVVDTVGGLQLSGVYATAAVLASVSGRSRSTAVVASLAVAAALFSGAWHGTLGEPAWSIRLLSCAVAGTAAVVAARLAEAYRQRIRHTNRLAQDLLDALAVELTGARSVTEVADAFLGRAAERLGAASAMVFILDDDDVMRLVAWFGRGGHQADQYSEFPLSADLPGAEAARSRAPRHFPDRAAIHAAFPALVGYYQEERSLHLLPLARGDSLQGLLALTFRPGAVTSDEERGLLVSLSGALSAALARAETLMAADAELRRAAILAEASRALSRSLDWNETLAEVSRLLVPDLADWCSLTLLRDGTLETVAVWHRDPETSAWAEGMRGVFPVDMNAPVGAPAVVRTGQAELHTSISAELIEMSAVSEEHAELLNRLGLVSAMVAPVGTGSSAEVIGAVSLAYAESGRRYTAEDVRLLTDLASRIGDALENAERFTRQSRRLTEVTKVAAAAQQAILSPPPPRLGPLSISARYVSAAEEAQVGGDLYEVIAREDRVRLLIGDVRGKGLSAVRVATIVLGGFRSVSVQDLPLEEVARQLDAHVRFYVEDDEDFVTAALVDIEHDGKFSVVLCGHPAPLVTHGEAWHQVEAEPGTPLGLGSDPVAAHGFLAPGDRMLLFTDGLLEARGPDRRFLEPEGLWALVPSTPFPQLLDALLGALRSWTDGRLQDDLALLSIQRRGVDEDLDPAAGGLSRGPEAGLRPARLARVLPPSGASVGEARRMVRTMLEDSELADLVDDAEAAISELVTNALVHAGSEVHVSASVTGSGLRVEVGDGSPHLPTRRDYAPTAGTGRGLLIVESLATRWSSFRLGTGKVVWFELAAQSGPAFEDLQAAPTPDRAVEETVEVELHNLPILMHAAWQEHAAALLREYLLARLDEDPDVLEAHAAASDAMTILYEGIAAPDLDEDPGALMDQAIEPHVSMPTATLQVPRDSVAHFAILDELICAALEMARAGEMLVPPTQPEIRAMSRWICREVAEQGAGETSPTPWRTPETEERVGPDELEVPGFDPSEVSRSPRGILASNETSLIVAASPSAVSLLGYDAEADLVGRPVICVVPRRYHQAHIAGTTLHAINGRDPLLGKPITVPVVRADGEEVPVELIVVARPLRTGRHVFIAEFSLGQAAPIA